MNAPLRLMRDAAGLANQLAALRLELIRLGLFAPIEREIKALIWAADDLVVRAGDVGGDLIIYDGEDGP